MSPEIDDDDDDYDDRYKGDFPGDSVNNNNDDGDDEDDDIDDPNDQDDPDEAPVAETDLASNQDAVLPPEPEDDDNRISPLYSASHTAEPQDRGGDTSINKRHDESAEEAIERSIERSLQKVSGNSVGEIPFTTEILHKVSAFITWPVTPPGCDCEDHRSDFNYAFHYYMRGQEEQPRMHVLQNNIIHLDELRLGQMYMYQVKYIYPNGTETAWSQEKVLSTGCT